MPSDPRIVPALAAVRNRIEAWRSAVAVAHERARTLLTAGGSAEKVAHELGNFAAGRIDVGRFAAIEGGHPALDAAARAVVLRADAVLDEFLKASDDAFVTEVPSGASLTACVGAAFAWLGRAFGAAAVVELARSGRYVAADHERYLDAYGFERWGRVERMLAPPLVVLVDGTDLRTGGLSDFLDGAVQVVLVARGACTPAPVVRLITPNVLVMQWPALDPPTRINSWNGPAVLALVSDACARFTHDPAGGKSAWQRLSVMSRPEPPKRALGLWSPAQQREELLHLDVLSTAPSLGDTPIDALAPGVDGSPVDRLASWLLTASGQAT